MSLKNAEKKINLKNDIKAINKNKRIKSNQKKNIQCNIPKHIY